MYLEIPVAIPLSMLSIFHKVYVANMVIKTDAFVCNICTQAVTPNEALPHIGRQPRRNAKDDRCNLPALL